MRESIQFFSFLSLVYLTWPNNLHFYLLLCKYHQFILYSRIKVVCKAYVKHWIFCCLFLRQIFLCCSECVHTVFQVGLVFAVLLPQPSKCGIIGSFSQDWHFSLLVPLRIVYISSTIYSEPLPEQENMQDLKVNVLLFQKGFWIIITINSTTYHRL